MFHNFMKSIFILLILWTPKYSLAIYAGNLTYSMASENTIVSKYVVNNNSSARVYRVTVSAINRPGTGEIQKPAPPGELLYTPKQLILQPGEGDFFKFQYRGPRDNIERYYRTIFHEISPQNRYLARNADSSVSIMPVVVLDTLLIVRPREINFKWIYDRSTGTFKNSGNTWFKLLLKPSCNSTEENGDVWYMRPGDTLRHETLLYAANIFIIYDEKFINVNHSCN